MKKKMPKLAPKIEQSKTKHASKQTMKRTLYFFSLSCKPEKGSARDAWRMMDISKQNLGTSVVNKENETGQVVGCFLKRWSDKKVSEPGQKKNNNDEILVEMFAQVESANFSSVKQNKDSNQPELRQQN